MSFIKSKNKKNDYKKFYRCKKCLMVSTRPRTNFVNGVCSGCINFAERKKLIGNKEKKLFGNYVIKLGKKMVITML